MKADTIIIGGGLTGLVSGIRLAESGKRVIIISSGQSALHFSSGSMDLLAMGSNPAEDMKNLPSGHPYSVVGAERSSALASEFHSMMKDAGVALVGDKNRNHYCITPIGEMKPTWLTLDDFPTFESADKMPWESVALVNLQGYLDLFPRFLARAFDRCGVKLVIEEFTLAELDRMRRSPSEMRATNMARILTGDVLERLASAINSTVTESVDAILMPAVVGLFDRTPMTRLREMVKRPLYFLPTLPTSVPGVRTQLMLRKRYQQLGGIYMLGDKVTGGEFRGDKLSFILSANLGKEHFEAHNYILATGNFFSHGLAATPTEIMEPIFRLDVDAPANRTEWLGKNFCDPQPFMGYGVKHDDEFHALRNGQPVDNLFVAGSIAGGCMPMIEGCGAGVCAVTALAVAETIKRKGGK